LCVDCVFIILIVHYIYMPLVSKTVNNWIYLIILAHIAHIDTIALYLYYYHVLKIQKLKWKKEPRLILVLVVFTYSILDGLLTLMFVLHNLFLLSSSRKVNVFKF